MKILNNKKFATAFIVSLFHFHVSAQTVGQWQYITTDSRLAYSFRTDKITQANSPQARKVWVRYDALKDTVLLNQNNPKSKRYAYALVQWIINCKADQISFGSQNYYESNGNAIFTSEGNEFVTSTVVPESVGDTIVSSFCVFIGERK